MILHMVISGLLEFGLLEKKNSILKQEEAHCQGLYGLLRCTYNYIALQFLKSCWNCKNVLFAKVAPQKLLKICSATFQKSPSDIIVSAPQYPNIVKP